MNRPLFPTTLSILSYNYYYYYYYYYYHHNYYYYNHPQLQQQ